MTKKKITISIDPDLFERINIFVMDNEDYLAKLTSSKKETGISTFINLVLRAVLIPERGFDAVMAIDENGDQNIEHTLRHLIDKATMMELKSS